MSVRPHSARLAARLAVALLGVAALGIDVGVGAAAPASALVVADSAAQAHPSAQPYAQAAAQAAVRSQSQAAAQAKSRSAAQAQLQAQAKSRSAAQAQLQAQAQSSETYTASISGTVKAADADHPAGQPLDGVTVEVYDRSDALRASTTTDGRGAYTVDRLAAGRYRLKFSALSTDLAPQWSGGAGTLSTAESLRVTAGNGRAGVDAVLVPGASIAGSVAAGGDALPNAVVVVYDADGDVAGYTNAGADGQYSVGKLAAGTYTLRVAQPWKSPYAAQWYEGANSRGAADAIEVDTGRRVSVEAIDLREGGAVAGTVTTSAGDALGGVTVLAHDRSGGDPAGRAVTGADGRYTIPNLGPGEYRIRFVSAERGEASGYRSTWFPGTPRALSATVVTVASRRTEARIDGSLTELPSISGTVTGATGTGGSPPSALSGVRVALVDGDGDTIDRATTAPDGGYRLAGIAPGEYRMAFIPPEGSLWHGEWWDGERRATATAIVITAESVLTGQDVELQRKAEVSGTVTGTGGRPVAGAAVRVLDTEGDSHGSAVTDFDGRYSIRGLDAGRYTLKVTKGGGAWRDQYWEGAGSADEAEYFTLARGQLLAGRDVQLMAARD